ncbi:Predicted arabinose efflux permease, MFS family [Arboricoccus pini]|uniref:Predicted arabinose efflux permease, MFS family n=2 Tax=Arboricoccus pini TaxID=1963835 RepID=A0A212RUH5_9PROT|nr:Predicted arabinose efflux permease, MFS family [Arboricoccus pini]
MTFVFALACGAMVANIYYAQPLIELIGPELGLHAALAGLVVTVTQLGYGAGLVFLVSLADLVENRRLILVIVGGAIVGSLIVAFSSNAWIFFAGSFMVGFCSVGAQILVPLASHLTPPSQRGRVIGNVMAGLLTGIMLARPFSSSVAALVGWRGIFVVSALIMLGLALILMRMLPTRRPQAGMHYGQILLSLVRLFLTLPELRRRTAYQGLMFAGFNLFWTAVPLVLSHSLGFGQRGIALFALAGAGGALMAPIAGRLADRGYTRPAVGIAMATLAAAFGLAGWAGLSGAILALAFAAVVLDAAVQTNQILSQRAVYELGVEIRGRLNAVYMMVVFLCGAVGSMAATLSYEAGGWPLTATIGVGLGLVALGFYATEFRARR